jgi:hypothetical protein
LLDDLHLQKNALYTLSFFLKKEQLKENLEKENLESSASRYKKTSDRNFKFQQVSSATSISNTFLN